MIQIKALRESRGMTQGDLAAEVGVGRSTVTMWETGQNTPPTKLLPALASALECTVDDLLKEPEGD